MKQIYFKFSVLLVCLVMGLGSAMAQVSVSGTATWNGESWSYDNNDGACIEITTGFIENTPSKTGTITFTIKSKDDNKYTDATCGIKNATVKLNNTTTSVTPSTANKNSGTYTKKNNEKGYKLSSATISYSFVKQPVYTKKNLSLAATNNEGYWATFSNANVTFFPATEVKNVYTVTANNEAKTMTKYELATAKGYDDADGYFVPANTGVLINCESNYATYYTVENKTGVTELTNNMLKPSTFNVDATTYTNYKLSYYTYDSATKTGSGLGFYTTASNTFAVKDGTAYLAVPNGNGMTLAKSFVMDDFETVTPIESVSAIGSNAPAYNLAGQRVSANAKGIVIVNGKKFFNK